MREDLQFNIEFCEEVQQYPNLYDYGRSDYCILNRSLTERTWEKIAYKFSVNSCDCKERWTNIRGSYSKYAAKLKKFGHGTKRVKEYYLAPYLFFLDPFLKSREPKANVIVKTLDESIIKNKAETSECEDNENCEIVLPDDCISVRSSQSSGPSNSSSVNDEPTSELITFEAPEPIEYNCTKRKHSSTTFDHDDNQRGYQNVKKRKQLLKISTKTIEPPDPDLSFLHSVLPDMKSMNSSQKRHFKIGILDLAEQILSSVSTTH